MLKVPAVTDRAPGSRLPSPTALAVTSCMPPDTGVPCLRPVASAASADTVPRMPLLGRIVGSADARDSSPSIESSTSERCCVGASVKAVLASVGSVARTPVSR